MRKALPLAAYLVAAILFHAAGHNPFHELFGAGDGYVFDLPTKIFASSFSSWNPWTQLGQYVYGDVQYQAFYPPALIVMRALPNTFGYNLFILAHYVAAGCFAYLFLRNRGLGVVAATFGGLCFELSGFLSAHKGHAPMLAASIWLPLMLYAVDRYFETRASRHLATGAVAVGLSLLGGFPQLSLYATMLTAAYACWRAATTADRPKLDRARPLVVCLATMGGVGALLAAIQFIPAAAALPYMTRQQLTFAAFSQDALPWHAFPSFIIPNLFGGLYGVINYAPNINFVEIYGYNGLLPLALAIGAVFTCAGRFKDTRFWTGVAVGATVLAVGAATPLYRLMFHVPAYNLFRAAARHLLEIDFAICVLAAVAVDTLISAVPDALRRSLLRWAGAALAAAFVVAIGISQFVGAVARYVAGPEGVQVRGAQVNVLYRAGDVAAEAARNLTPWSATILLPAAGFVLSLGMIALLWRRPPGVAVRILFVAIVCADLYSAHAFIYQYPDTRAAFHPETRAEIALMRARGYDPGRDRVFPVEPELDNTYPNLNLLSGLSVINGYTPMWSTRYQDFSGFFANGVQDPTRLPDSRLLELTSARYVLTRTPSMRARIAGARRLPVSTESSDIRAPASSEWMLRNAAPAANGLSLCPEPTASLCLAASTLPLQPHAFYLIRFEARAPAGLAGPLIVDLYGSRYDDPQQERTLRQLSADFSPQSLLVESGPRVPGDGRLRMFTVSGSRIEIRNVTVARLSADGRPAFEEIGTTADGISVFVNPAALPRFRFATSLQPAADVTAARRLVDGLDFDPASAVTVEGLQKTEQVEAGVVVSQSIQNTDMRWVVRTPARSFFVVGDTFFPGWTATVDGQPARIHAVNGFLRGVFVEGAGEHTVRMTFAPPGLKAGIAATGIGAVMAALLWMGGLPRRKTHVYDDVLLIS